MRFLRSLSCLVVLSAFPTAFGQTDGGLHGVAVSPVLFRVPAEAGSDVRLALRLQNFEPRALTAALSFHSVAYADWSYAPKMDAPNPSECASWFRETRPNVSVGAFGTVTLDLAAHVPHVRPGVYYCALVIDPALKTDPRMIRAEYQIPIVLFVGRQSRPDLRFGTPQLEGTPEHPVLAVPVENDSDAFTVVGADMALRNVRTGSLTASVTDYDRNLYPHTKRKLVFNIQPLTPGEFLATYRAQAGRRVFDSLQTRYVVNHGKIAAATPSAVLGLPPVVADPSYLRVAMPAGATRYLSFRISNQGSKPLTLQAEARALHQSGNGLFALDETPPPADLRVSMMPDSLTLPPRRTATVRVAVTPSSGAHGESWFGVRIKATDGATMPEYVYGTAVVAGTGTPKLDVALEDVRRASGVPVAIDFHIKNTGDMALTPLTAAVVMRGATTVARLEVPRLGDGGVLPGSVLHNHVALPAGLKPGAYLVEIDYQYAEKLTARLAVPVEIKAGGKR